MTQLFVVGLGIWLLGRALPVPNATWISVVGAVLVILSAVVSL